MSRTVTFKDRVYDDTMLQDLIVAISEARYTITIKGTGGSGAPMVNIAPNAMGLESNRIWGFGATLFGSIRTALGQVKLLESDPDRQAARNQGGAPTTVICGDLTEVCADPKVKDAPKASVGEKTFVCTQETLDRVNWEVYRGNRKETTNE